MKIMIMLSCQLTSLSSYAGPASASPWMARPRARYSLVSLSVLLETSLRSRSASSMSSV